jgi:hypothetical protein
VAEAQVAVVQVVECPAAVECPAEQIPVVAANPSKT